MIKNNKGITLITLSIAILIMLIITSTLLYNINTGGRVKKLNNMYNDITKLKDEVDLYYATYNTIPVISTKYENIESIQSINPNDNSTYYVIDLEALNNIRLNYGKDYTRYKANPSNDLKDLYVINERSHSIYYIKGIEFESNIYYTIPGDYTKIETNSVTNIKIEKMDNNVAIVKISAVDKTNGIKQMKLFINEQEYKVYDYNKDFMQMKTEILNITLPFGHDYICYLEIIGEDGNITKSNEYVLQNTSVITTVEDLENLATLVNGGTNTFAGRTITLMNDIDLKGSQTNQWTPIGNVTHAFEGTFEGNGHTISGIYINNPTLNHQGLFGDLKSGTIKNITTEGTVTANQTIGGILGYNNGGNIENCTNKCIIYGAKYNIGGIVGHNSGTIRGCKNNGNVTGFQNVGGVSGNNIAIITKSYNMGTVQHTSDGNWTLGGIVGWCTAGEISLCYNDGKVISKYQGGGILGGGKGNIKVSNCYNIKDIEGIDYIGGIEGRCDTSATVMTIENCYNIGNLILTKETEQGGILGKDINGNAFLKNCYYLEGTSTGGQTGINMPGKAEAKSLAGMKTPDFVSKLNVGQTSWKLVEGKNNGYPILAWQ